MEEGKVRLLVIAIVAMLAVTIVVAGWQYEDQEPIEWEEGFAESAVRVPSSSHDPGRRHDEDVSNPAIAVSTINGEEALELNVTPRYSDVTSAPGLDRQKVREFNSDVLFSVDGDIPAELEPEELIIETEVKEAPELDDIVLDHHLSQWEAQDLDLWPREELNTGTGGEEPLVLGSDIEDNSFSGQGRFDYSYWDRDVPFDEPITIEVTAILRGLAEEVTARAEIMFEKEEA